MAEYIEREAVKAEFRKNFAYGQNENFVKWLERVACEIVDKIPVADVQPVIHAAWIETTPNDFYEWYKCSNCKYTDTKKFNYCPKCGAKMDC